MQSNRKWYNVKEMVGVLLFVFPPLGIYGVYRSETIPAKWKNIVYLALGLTVLFFSVRLF